MKLRANVMPIETPTPVLLPAPTEMEALALTARMIEVSEASMITFAALVTTLSCTNALVPVRMIF